MLYLMGDCIPFVFFVQPVHVELLPLENDSLTYVKLVQAPTDQVFRLDAKLSSLKDILENGETSLAVLFSK